MALTFMTHGLSSPPASVIQSGLLNNISILDLVPCQRLQRCFLLRESKLRNMMEVMSLVGKHSTDFEAKGGEEKLLINNMREGKSIAGSIVALGKFDALHIGHRALAIQASKMGTPVLLSFTGMAEILQWEKRLPIVAACDRKRIMSLWASVCDGMAPLEYHLEFAKVRSLSPHDFVERLAKQLLVKGVVAGANYRFGYKAAGDASDLVQLCGKFGLGVSIVDPVMDATVKSDEVPAELGRGDSREKGQVSSTRIRKALGVGDLKRVTELLGRDHRLVLRIDDGLVQGRRVLASTSDALNQAPTDGSYSAKISLFDDVFDEVFDVDGSHGAEAPLFMDGVVEIRDERVVVMLSNGSFPTGWKGQRYIAIDLQSKISA